ncbi:MAG: fimbrillin family protein, partial [Bacilli bacterium]
MISKNFRKNQQISSRELAFHKIFCYFWFQGIHLQTTPIMNFFKSTGTAVLLLFVFASCTPQDSPDSGFLPAAPISFTGSTEDPATRTTLRDGTHTYWEAVSDRIGMFSAQGRTSQEDDPPACNVPFTAQNSASSSEFTGSMYWGEAEAEHTFYAYYPYDSDYSGGPAAV